MKPFCTSEKHVRKHFSRLALFFFFILFSGVVSSQITLGFQGGEVGDTWGFTSTGASAIAQNEAQQGPNIVSGAASIVVGGNTGGGNCFAGGSGNGPSTPRTFTFNSLDISSSNSFTRTLTFSFGTRFPHCSGPGWDSGENLVFTAYHNGVAQPSATLATGFSDMAFDIHTNSYSWSVPPCVSQFSFVISVTTNRSDEYLFLDNVKLTTPQLNPPLTVSPITGDNPVCAGTTENYSVTAVSGTTYTWSGLPAGATFTTANGTTAASTVGVNWGTAAAGTYTLMVTPSNACGTAGTPQTLSVTVLPAPVPVTISGPTSLCSGDVITLTSSYANGTTWLPNGETTQSISVSSAGTYSISVLTSCGTITASHTVTLNASNPASITAGGPTSFCPGGSVTLTSNSATGNSWSTGETTQSITVTTAGTYDLSVTDACATTTASQQITILSLANPQISGTTSFCAGQQTTLTASGGDTYLWSGGETTAAITINTPGVYTVTATNSCGQVTSTPVTVTQNPLPNPQISGNTSFCAGQQTTLTASGGDLYLWSNGQTTTAITVNTPGTYVLVASNSCGQDTASVTITQNPLPNPQISGTPSFCAGQQTTLAASGGDTYLWAGGETTTSIIINTPGVYTVTATNSCGQATSAPFTVTQNALPNAQISGDLTICSGQQTTLTASGGNTYSWTNGETTAAITVNTGGNYTVTASNSCGTDTKTVTVTVSTVSASFTADPVTGAAPLPVNFTNTSDPGAVSFHWDFDNGSTETGHSPLQVFSQGGQYAVQLTVTDANGCSDSYSLVILVTDLPSSLTVPNIFTPNGDQVNDQFIITHENMESYELQILNRWGNVILNTSNPNQGWDGKIQGDLAEEGTYFYQITATGIDKKNYNETGFFVLQR